MTFWERLRALGWFLLAAAWFLFSDLVAYRAAAGLSFGDWLEPLYRVFDLFLLVLGYWAMSRMGQRKVPGAKATGLWVRPGWKSEAALGAAVGWGGVVACVLPTALIGGLAVTIFASAHQFWILLLDTIALAAGTLAIEVAFRGYAFQRLKEAMGPVMATFFLSVIFAIWRTHTTETTAAVVVTSFLLGWVLSVAALRTRALWVSWGFHFAWAAAMAMLFGLPMGGPMDYSPVLVTNPVGPTWITGGGQGPEGSAFGILVGVALLVVMASVTTDLKYKFGFDELVPGGIPVDIDAAARRQHEAAMAQAAATPKEPQLVQILPASGASVRPTVSAAPAEVAEEETPEKPGPADEAGPEAS